MPSPSATPRLASILLSRQFHIPQVVHRGLRPFRFAYPIAVTIAVPPHSSHGRVNRCIPLQSSATLPQHSSSSISLSHLPHAHEIPAGKPSACRTLSLHATANPTSAHLKPFARRNLSSCSASTFQLWRNNSPSPIPWWKSGRLRDSLGNGDSFVCSPLEAGSSVGAAAAASNIRRECADAVTVLEPEHGHQGRR